jgi:hypothetical protein
LSARSFEMRVMLRSGLVQDVLASHFFRIIRAGTPFRRSIL